MHTVYLPVSYNKSIHGEHRLPTQNCEKIFYLSVLKHLSKNFIPQHGLVIYCTMDYLQGVPVQAYTVTSSSINSFGLLQAAAAKDTASAVVNNKRCRRNILLFTFSIFAIFMIRKRSCRQLPKFNFKGNFLVNITSLAEVIGNGENY